MTEPMFFILIKKLYKHYMNMTDILFTCLREIQINPKEDCKTVNMKSLHKPIWQWLIHWQEP